MKMRFHNLLVLLFVIAKAFPSDPVTLNKSDIYSATVSCYSGLLVRENSQVSLYDGQTRIGIAMALRSMRNFNVQFDVTTGPHPRLKFIANGSCEPNISTTANLSLHYPRQQNHVNITVRDTLDSPIVISGTVGCSHGPIYLNSSIELSETCLLPGYSQRIERTLSPVPVEGSKPPMATYTFYIPRRHEAAIRNVINAPPYCYITFTHVCHTNETPLARVEMVNDQFIVKHLEIETLPMEYQLYECAKFGRLRKPKPQSDFFENGEKLLLKMTGKLNETDV